MSTNCPNKCEMRLYLLYSFHVFLDCLEVIRWEFGRSNSKEGRNARVNKILLNISKGLIGLFRY